MTLNLTTEQLNLMPTPRLMEWFSKAREALHELSDEQEILALKETMLVAKSIFEAREIAKREKKLTKK